MFYLQYFVIFYGIINAVGGAAGKLLAMRELSILILVAKWRMLNASG